MPECWDPSLETGDPLVDRQHREIAELVEYVRVATDSADQIMLVLDRLMVHVDTHFAIEEDLMARSAYAQDAADPHMAEHRRLIRSARDTVMQFRTGRLTSTKALAEFLYAWLCDHIERHDRAFITFVREAGFSARALGEGVPRPSEG
jgi:hemerythrin